LFPITVYPNPSVTDSRTCLRYFLPPQWVMDKDSISGMTPQELGTFPLDDFFDHYEKGLRKVRYTEHYTLVVLYITWYLVKYTASLLPKKICLLN